MQIQYIAHFTSGL